MRILRLPGILLTMLVWALPSLAQPRAPLTRQLVPVPFNDSGPVEVSVSLDPPKPEIGATVTICFQAAKAGFATLWNFSTKNEVTRIFPNAFLANTATAPVEANRHYCAGTGGDPFRFRVDGPPGTEDLYLLWTARPELQPNQASYADATALVSDMQRLGGARNADWATAKVTYDIVEPPTAPVAPPSPVAPIDPVAPNNPVVPPGPLASNNPPIPVAPTPVPPAPAAGEAATPKVWVLAMGANVQGLTKSNQDAAMFSQAITNMFAVAPANVRLINNAKLADWRNGMIWLRDNAKPADFVFIYFSGHGGQFKNPSSDDGLDEFLVPYDWETPHPDPKDLVFGQLLDGWINALPTANVISVMDACHSAGVYRSLEADVLGARKKVYRLTEDEAAAALAASNRTGTRAAGGRGRIKANGVLLAAAHRDQSALEGSKGSFFTLALVYEMQSKEGGTLAEVFDRTIKTTEKITSNRQDPEAVGNMDVARHVKFGQ